MNSTLTRIASILFAAASLVLWVSDRIYQLPLPPVVAQYWPGILALAILIEGLRRGKVTQKDVQNAIETWARIPFEKPIPLTGNEKNTAQKKISPEAENGTEGDGKED